MTPAYLSLSDAATYCGRTGSADSRARWARRNLVPHLPLYRLPNSTPTLRKVDLDALMMAHRHDPVNVSKIVNAVMGRKGGK